jgi:hypothetical protein
MFGDLKAVVDVIRSATESVRGFNDSKEKQNYSLELLRIYFLLMDVVKDGTDLLDSIDSDPLKVISSLYPEQAKSRLNEWDSLVRKQGSRLYSLSGRLLGQDALSVIDPSLKDRLEELVSSKFERADSLHGIGAGLVIYSMFGKSEEQDWLVGVIQSMYLAQEEGHINVPAAREEIEKLRKELEEYRTVCIRLIGEQEVMKLSKKARADTCFDSNKDKDSAIQTQAQPNQRMQRNGSSR